jgi:hypothetical protein
MSIARPLLILASSAVFFLAFAACLWVSTTLFGAPAWKTSAVAGLLAGCSVFALADRVGIAHDETSSANLLFGDPIGDLPDGGDDRSDLGEPIGLVRNAMEIVHEISHFNDSRK